MATEKTPLLMKDEVVIVIADIKSKKLFDANNSFNRAESLNYEQLLPFIVDPYWIRVRKIWFSLFVLSFIVILLAACISAFISATTASSSCRISTHVSQSDKGFPLNGTDIVAALISQTDHM